MSTKPKDRDDIREYEYTARQLQHYDQVERQRVPGQIAAFTRAPTDQRMRMDFENIWERKSVQQRRQYVVAFRAVDMIVKNRVRDLFNILADIGTYNNMTAGPIALQNIRANMIQAQQVSQAYGQLRNTYQATQAGVIVTFQALRDELRRHAQTGACHADVLQQAEDDADREWDRLRHMRGEQDRWADLATHPPVPARADGLNKIKRVDLLGRIQDRPRIFAAFPTQPLFPVPLSLQNWLGGWPLGEGGFGTAALWVRLDDVGLVDDRIVKKLCTVEGKDWQKSMVGDPRKNTRQPTEVFCHTAVSQVGSRRPGTGANPATVSVPGIRDPLCVVDDTTFSFYYYMEYCPHGDLDDLIRTYMNQVPAHLPEPFLWYTFWCLAEVGLVMRQGNTSLFGVVEGGWEGIVHRDIKPPNILLGGPTPGHFDQYPTPKLADFGLAIRTFPGDLLNPHAYSASGLGTPGYKAPEQTLYVDVNTLLPVDRDPLDAYTNVYGIGMTMHALTSLIPNLIDPQFLGERNAPANLTDVHGSAQFQYSQELLDLIRDCLIPDPAQRPSFATIIMDIERHTAPGPGDLARNALAGIVNLADVLTLRADLYHIGMARANLPPSP